MRKIHADSLRITGFLIVFLCAASVFAQNSALNQSAGSDTVSAPQTADAFDAKNELSVWGGFSPDTPNIFGGSRDTKYGQIALRYSRRIASTENIALKYTVDFIPVALLNYDTRRVVQTAPATFVTELDRTTAYGAGVAPVGFQLNFRRRKKVQPFLVANAGFIVFNKTVPDDRSAVFPDRAGTRLNFATAGGGGVEFANEDGKSFTVGFKIHHISNASRGEINPGFDQNLFFFGYTFKKW